MLPEVEKLLIIQHRDQNIRALDQRIAKVPLEEEDIRERLAEEKEAAARALKAYQEAEVEIKKIELDVETRRDTIAKLKVQQFETKKNEEFRRIGEEITRYEGEVSDLEDSEIECMEKAEELNRILAEAREQLAESEEAVETDVASLHRSQETWKKEKREDEEKRAEAAGEIDEDLLDIYDRLFSSKNGNAVVGLTDGQCSGCHMKVIKATVVEVKTEKEIAYCENCGRILYWWTDESSGKGGTSNEY